MFRRCCVQAIVWRSVFFFFQAEDGIRDWSVTGVQTCALPISALRAAVGRLLPRREAQWIEGVGGDPAQRVGLDGHALVRGRLGGRSLQSLGQIGRASCREREWVAGGGGELEKERDEDESMSEE